MLFSSYRDAATEHFHNVRRAPKTAKIVLSPIWTKLRFDISIGNLVICTTGEERENAQRVS